MSITPKAIQDLLDELEASKQSRLRAWNALQRIRALLSDLGKTEIPLPARMTFDAEGEIFAPPKRGDQKSVFFGAPVPGRHDQGRMQKRLSARSSGNIESSESSRRFNLEPTVCGRYRRTTSSLAQRPNANWPQLEVRKPYFGKWCNRMRRCETSRSLKGFVDYENSVPEKFRPDVGRSSKDK